MTQEQQRTLEAIQFAVQMEIDGKEYYLKVSRESGNELGRRLLESLAAEEDKHRQRFVRIYEAIRSEQDWPIILPQAGEERKLRTVFAEATKKIKSKKVRVRDTELDAVQTAMKMENRSYDYYQGQAAKAAKKVERDFYQAISAEESYHHQVLLEYYEYLRDPVIYFAAKERPSLDGG